MDPDYLPPASQSLRKGVKTGGGKRGQTGREVYQTSLWGEQDREKGGDRRRDSAPEGSKCLLNKSTTSRKSKYAEGNCHKVGAFYNMPTTVLWYPK